MSDSERGQTETRARRAIREAAERKGATNLLIEWEPIRAGAEMEGAAGGWTVMADLPGDQTDHALGYGWREVVEWIDKRWPATSEDSP